MTATGGCGIDVMVVTVSCSGALLVVSLCYSCIAWTILELGLLAWRRHGLEGDGCESAAKLPGRNPRRGGEKLVRPPGL